jgi:uncharacterized Zn finger protein
MKKEKPYLIRSSREAPFGSVVRLKSEKGKIGNTWLAQEFVALLENTCEKGRMQRALKCGRDGTCSDLKIRPGRMMVEVSCSGKTVHGVWLRFSEFSPETWERIVSIIASDLTHTGTLYSGEMTREFTDLLRTEEIILLPGKFSDVGIICDCGKGKEPCIHGSVAWYLLTEALDENPWHLLTLRGLCREEIISRVTALAEARLAQSGKIIPDFSQPDPEAPVPVPHVIAADGFYSLNGNIRPFPEPGPGNTGINPVSLLGPAPYRMAGRNLADHILALYPDIRDYAKKFGQDDKN